MKLLRGGVDTYLEKHNWKENMLLKLPCTWHMKQQIVRFTAVDISFDSFTAYWYFKEYQMLEPENIATNSFIEGKLWFVLYQIILPYPWS